MCSFSVASIEAFRYANSDMWKFSVHRKKGAALVTDQEVLQIYMGLVQFLAKVCGSGCEIVVHDVTDPERSLMAIENNISGREVGNPMTDLARELAEKSAYTDADYIANYSGRSKNCDFLSSTFFIKNEGRLIGLLCVNKDVTTIKQMCSTLHGVLYHFNLELPKESGYNEDLDNPVDNLLPTRITDVINQSGVSPSRMRMEEKIKIVQRLNESGILSMKGAVAEVARQLSVSIPTVYRYINKSISE